MEVIDGAAMRESASVTTGPPPDGVYDMDTRRACFFFFGCRISVCADWPITRRCSSRGCIAMRSFAFEAWHRRRWTRSLRGTAYDNDYQRKAWLNLLPVTLRGASNFLDSSACLIEELLRVSVSWHSFKGGEAGRINSVFCPSVFPCPLLQRAFKPIVFGVFDSRVILNFQMLVSQNQRNEMREVCFATQSSWTYLFSIAPADHVQL